MSVLARFGLAGKVAVVTGGSRGIGRAIALGLADAGASVVVASRDMDKCIEVAGEVAHRGGRGLGVACDVAREDDLVRLFARVGDELGGTDVFVHSAGLAAAAPAAGTSRADMQRMLDVHLLGGVTGAQQAAAQMERRHGGSIVFVASTFGLGGTTRMLAYGTAKAALAHAVKVLAVEWARAKIRVNAIAPGFVETDMTSGVEPTARDAMIKRIPLRRPASPEEMAGPALFLASDASSFVTGQTLVVDGGERAR